MSVVVFTIVILLVDQLSKQWVLAMEVLPWWLIDGQVGFQLSYNEGIAFSFPLTGYAVLVVSILVTLGLIWYFSKYFNRSQLTICTQGFIVGGALGNIIDRLLHGAVVDFIKIYSYPIFNLADVFVFVGVVMLVVFYERLMVNG